MTPFWRSLDNLFAAIWTATDDAWKVLRWIAASTTVLAVYAQTTDIAVLFLGVGLAVFAVGSLAALMMRWCVRGLTEKGRDTGGLASVLIALAFFLFSISFAILVWSTVAALYIRLVQLG